MLRRALAAGIGLVAGVPPITDSSSRWPTTAPAQAVRAARPGQLPRQERPGAEDSSRSRDPAHSPASPDWPRTGHSDRNQRSAKAQTLPTKTARMIGGPTHAIEHHRAAHLHNVRSGAARTACRPTETCRQIGGSARVLANLPASRSGGRLYASRIGCGVPVRLGQRVRPAAIAAAQRLTSSGSGRRPGRGRG
jgi:hypothetical protein